jgi:hypothetical protein
LQSCVRAFAAGHVDSSVIAGGCPGHPYAGRYGGACCPSVACYVVDLVVVGVAAAADDVD